MEKNKLEQLEKKNIEQVTVILSEFNQKHADLLVFDKFHANNQWHDLWLALFAILDDVQLSGLYILCLNTVRILTRDEYSLQTNRIENQLNTLLHLAKLDNSSNIEQTTAKTTTIATDIETIEVPTATPLQLAVPLAIVYKKEKMASVDVIAESLKCICNLIYQSSECRRQCMRNQTVDAILKRVASNMQYPSILEYYDMQLLFLLTALETKARSRLQLDLNGITYMTKWLDDKLTEKSINDEQMKIIAEMLKVMFNITSSPDKSPNEYEIESLHLTSVLRELLLRFQNLNNDSGRNVVTHAINLLTNISSSCLTELTVKSTETVIYAEPDNSVVAAGAIGGADATNCEYNALCFEKRNVSVLDVLLRYLQQALEQQESEATTHELLSPVLTVLVKCARADRVMRHYLRNRVLPPLRNVSQRPEIGNELRNHLCRFLTLPAMLLRDLSADLLFVLCKENVGRMIKYTGYGNAAGLFANRGLLDCRRIEHAEYSSDSEDSDTEEYKQQQAGINPILGCYEAPKINPLEGMSEEQKEYEVMQLVGLIDKLRKNEIIQPCRIGEDGKPQPLEHILQLQEELPQQELEKKRKT